MPRKLSFVSFDDLGGKHGDNFLSHTCYMYICIKCMNFPDVNNMLCVTLLMCVFCLLLWILSFLYSKRERMCVAEDGAQKGFPAFVMSAFLECGVIVVCNGALLLTH